MSSNREGRAPSRSSAPAICQCRTAEGLRRGQAAKDTANAGHADRGGDVLLVQGAPGAARIREINRVDIFRNLDCDFARLRSDNRQVVLLRPLSVGGECNSANTASRNSLLSGFNCCRGMRWGRALIGPQRLSSIRSSCHRQWPDGRAAPPSRRSERAGQRASGCRGGGPQRSPFVHCRNRAAPVTWP